VRAAREELREGLRALLGLEPVGLLDGHPRQFAAPPGELVAAARELLLLLEQLVALRLPFLPVPTRCSVIDALSLLWIRRLELLERPRRSGDLACSPSP
jgi:hypothetical protein